MCSLKESYKLAIRMNKKKMKKIEEKFPSGYTIMQDWKKLDTRNKMFERVINGTYRKK